MSDLTEQQSEKKLAESIINNSFFRKWIDEFVTAKVEKAVKPINDRLNQVNNNLSNVNNRISSLEDRVRNLENRYP